MYPSLSLIPQPFVKIQSSEVQDLPSRPPKVSQDRSKPGFTLSCPRNRILNKRISGHSQARFVLHDFTPSCTEVRHGASSAGNILPWAPTQR